MTNPVSQVYFTLVASLNVSLTSTYSVFVVASAISGGSLQSKIKKVKNKTQKRISSFLHFPKIKNLVLFVVKIYLFMDSIFIIGRKSTFYLKTCN